MSFDRNKELDRQRTATLLSEVANGATVSPTVPNWLGHMGDGNSLIDIELLWGTTMPQMLMHRPAVEEHLWHLITEHGLTVLERNGVYRLAVLPSEPS